MLLWREYIVPSTRETKIHTIHMKIKLNKEGGIEIGEEIGSIGVIQVLFFNSKEKIHLFADENDVVETGT